MQRPGSCGYRCGRSCIPPHDLESQPGFELGQGEGGPLRAAVGASLLRIRAGHPGQAVEPPHQGAEIPLNVPAGIWSTGRPVHEPDIVPFAPAPQSLAVKLLGVVQVGRRGGREGGVGEKGGGRKERGRGERGGGGGGREEGEGGRREGRRGKGRRKKGGEGERRGERGRGEGLGQPVHGPLDSDADLVEPVVLRQAGHAKCHRHRRGGRRLERHVESEHRPRRNIEHDCDPRPADRQSCPLLHDDDVDQRVIDLDDAERAPGCWNI